MSNTSRFVRPLLEILFPGSPVEIIALYHGYIRKFAHFAEYAVLAFWAALAFSDSKNRILQQRWHFAAFLTVVLVAVADETNQSFNAARTGSAWDVAIDAAGGLTMILFFRAAKGIWEKRAKRKPENNVDSQTFRSFRD